MSTQITNRKASQALRGTATLVTVDSTDQAQLANFTKGMLCTHDQSGRTGTVYRVDYEGTSFLVKPIQPNTEFGIYGYLPVSATVTVAIP